ncbi:MAG TPA: AbrB/MazE/SpoVT family DNA-binding domain-containing protein [Acidimicrobiales bacterium]|jgi:transcriptional pleiotropic regulator of transition state genes|nr:AbrB/MazE/SpoVT family DNA-binding domain-containing protein [Acidimicrobiales bacterium]
MPSAGITRTIDRLGRIVVPVEFRRALAIGDHDSVEISLEADRIVMTKVERACVFCAASTDLRPHHDRLVCASCVAALTGSGRVQRAQGGPEPNQFEG